MFRRWLLIIVSVLVLVAAFFILWAVLTDSRREVSMTELYGAIEAGQVKELTITIDSSKVTGNFTDGEKFQSRVINLAELEKTALSYGVPVNADPPSILTSWVFWVVSVGVLGIIVYIFLFVWMVMRQKKAQGLTLGKESDAPLRWLEKTNVTLGDVAGCDEVKEEVLTYVNFLRDPDRYTRLGGRLAKGILLAGHPGTGKTLIAKAIAGEANVRFGFSSGSDFVKIYVGEGPARVRLCFNELRKNQPCIWVLDEADALGKRGPAALHQEYNQTINAFNAEMDGLKPNDRILIMFLTNDPLALDPSLLRAGRLDKRLIVDLPDVKGREEILKVHTRKVILAKDIDLGMVAKATPELAGSELENIVNEAAVKAAERGAKAVEQQDLMEAIDSTIYGPEKKNRKILEERRNRVAYHEAGHAVAMIYKPGGMKIRKVTIVPRGLAGGANHCLPENEGIPETNEYLMARLVGFMGGRAAEELIFGNFSSGPKADLTNATDVAKKMVCEYGMTEAGLRTFAIHHNFLKIDSNEQLDCSPQKQAEIDKAIDKLLNDAYQEALKIIKEHQTGLEALTRALLEKEKLTGEEAEEIVKSAITST